MADVINLRMARKAKARGEADAAAAENRAKFGRTKAAKAGTKMDLARERRDLDGARRED